MAGKTVSSTKEKDSLNADEAGDAWEAAQHILNAINFGSLNDEPSTPASRSSAAGTSQAAATASTSAPPPPIMASLGIDISANEDDGLGRATLTDEERASLQAQLALLAAQLSEIAAGEDDEDEDEDQDQEMHIPPPTEQPPQISQAIIVPTPSHHDPLTQRMIMDVNQFPDDGEGFTLITPEAPSIPRPSLSVPAPSPEPVKMAPMASLQSPSAPEPEEESDEDEDMEMVDVDDYMRTEGIRT